MAKKRSQKKLKKSKAKLAHLSINELPNAGQNYLKQGKFAEAIKVFRRLSQESEEEKWAEPLRASFQGRINQLAAKCMHKEALVIFHNMEKLVPAQAPELQALHILLLIHTDQLDKAGQLYEKIEDALTRQQKQLVDETFAALLLSGKDTLIQQIPPESAVRNQFFQAQQALRCYSEGKDCEALEYLQSIPFRSPYKNFRIALNGMLAFHENEQKALSFFDKIHANSPFFALISPYLHLLKDTEGAKERKSVPSVPSVPANFGKPEKKAVELLQGLDKDKIKLLASLKKNTATPVGFIRCLLNAGTCLDDKVVRHLCYQLLIQDLSCRRMYEKKFGPIKDEFELVRLEALASQIQEDPYNLIQKWQQACQILSKRKDPDDALKIALIHRHIAAWMHRIHGDKHRWKEQREELEKSLEYDPDDKATWLRIHQLFHKAPAEQYRWVNRMLKQFPQEPDVLFLGAEAAVGRSAFKKASRLAQDLLKIDPINNKVRALLIGAHINHAHKLAKQKKYVLASKECDHAAVFGRGGVYQGRIEINRGLIELLQGREEQGQALVEKGEARYDEQQILARVQVRMDAELLPIPLTWREKFTTRLKSIIKGRPRKEDLLQIVSCLMARKRNKLLAWKAVQTVLLPYLKKGTHLDLHKDEFVMLCQAWQSVNEFTLLHIYGKKAAQLWSDVPLFTYFLVVGKSEAGKKGLADKDIEGLEDASHRAMRQKDSATANLIDDFLNKHAYASFGFSGGPPIGMLAGLLEQEMFNNDDGEKKQPSKEEIKRFFELFGDL